MPPIRMRAFVFLGLLALPSCFALFASSGSTCASHCGSLITNTTDLSCNDSAYNTTALGEQFESCMSCLQSSTSYSSETTDQLAFLYNLRATMAACLYSFPSATSTTSNSACNIPFGCGPLQQSMETGITNATNGTGYEYCAAGFNQDSLISCVQCFQASEDQKFLGNFLIALEAGCQQQPKPGEVMALSGSVFTDTQVTIGAPATVVPTQKSGPAVPTGAIIGIVFVILLVIAAIVGIVLIKRRRKQRRANTSLKGLKSDYDARYGAAGTDTPMPGFASKDNISVHTTESLPAYEMQDQNLGNSHPTERYGIGLGLGRVRNESNASLAQPLASNPHLARPPMHQAHEAELSNTSRAAMAIKQKLRSSSNHADAQSISEGDRTPGVMEFMRGAKGREKARALKIKIPPLKT